MVSPVTVIFKGLLRDKGVSHCLRRKRGRGLGILWAGGKLELGPDAGVREEEHSCRSENTYKITKVPESTAVVENRKELLWRELGLGRGKQ